MSAAKQKYDLTQGGILNKLLLVSLPIMGTQLMQMLYNLTDMFWLGRVGSDAVAASGTAGMYLWLSNALLFIGRMGAEIGVAQQLGKGDRKSARSYCQNALFLALILGVAYAAFGMIFSRPLIGFFNMQEQNVVEDAIDYLVITVSVTPAVFIAGAVAGTFTASGNSRLPFVINALGVILNVVLDPVLIMGFGMGVIGAAIATSFAQVVVCVLSVIAIRWRRTCPLGAFRFRHKPDKEKVAQIFKWSTPVAAESMLFTVFSMVISRFIAVFGADAIAANKIGIQVESLSWLIGGGFSSALTAFVGQNYGAGKWGRIRSGVRIATIVMAIWGVIVTLILFFAGGAIFSLFLPDPKLVEIGASYLRILATCQIVATLEGVGAGSFRGIGKTLPPSVASIVSNGSRVILVYFLAKTSLGLDGIWWGIAIGAGVRGLWIFLWLLIMLRQQPKDDLPEVVA